MSRSVAEQRFTVSLMTGFAALALLLAAVGIYGVMAYSVSQRTREIGIRLAMGAEGGTVGRMVVRQGMMPAVAGIALGLAAAGLLSRLLQTLLYGVTPHDPTTYVVIPGLLLLVALAATVLPALRATRVDPLVALRYE